MCASSSVLTVISSFEGIWVQVYVLIVARSCGSDLKGGSAREKERNQPSAVISAHELKRLRPFFRTSGNWVLNFSGSSQSSYKILVVFTIRKEHLEPNLSRLVCLAVAKVYEAGEINQL